MTTDKRITVSVTHDFIGHPEEIFDAFLDPAQAAKFMFVTDTGKIVRCDVDARVGGKFVITDRRDGEDIAHEGEFVELDRPRRLGFDVRVPKYSPDAGRVIVEIRPKVAGCEVTLTESMGPEWEPHRKSIEAGWKGILVGRDRMLTKSRE
jgi:uncharacterized protein YndB with AHSA1/START domain